MDKQGRWLLAALGFGLILITASASWAESPETSIQEITDQEFQDNPAGPVTETKELDAAAGWQDSGIKLQKGDRVYIKATGSWGPGWPYTVCGPEGVAESLRQIPLTLDCPFASLIGRIGESKPFCLEERKAFLVTSAGSLQYSINETPETLKDNKGSLALEIQIKPEGLIVSSASAAEDQAKLPLALFDFHALNVSSEESQVLNLILRTQLAQSTRYKVMERNDFERMAKKQGLSRMDVTDPRLAGRIGKSAGAKKVLLGELGKLGETYTMTLTLVDVETGEVEKTASKACKCAKDELADVINELAAQLGK